MTSKLCVSLKRHSPISLSPVSHGATKVNGVQFAQSAGAVVSFSHSADPITVHHKLTKTRRSNQNETTPLQTGIESILSRTGQSAGPRSRHPSIPRATGDTLPPYCLVVNNESSRCLLVPNLRHYVHCRASSSFGRMSRLSATGRGLP